jgi:hypothetical protein
MSIRRLEEKAPPTPPLPEESLEPERRQTPSPLPLKIARYRPRVNQRLRLDQEDSPSRF